MYPRTLVLLKKKPCNSFNFSKQFRLSVEWRVQSLRKTVSRLWTLYDRLPILLSLVVVTYDDRATLSCNVHGMVGVVDGTIWVVWVILVIWVIFRLLFVLSWFPLKQNKFTEQGKGKVACGVHWMYAHWVKFLAVCVCRNTAGLLGSLGKPTLTILLCALTKLKFV